MQNGADERLRQGREVAAVAFLGDHSSNTLHAALWEQSSNRCGMSRLMWWTSEVLGAEA